MRYSVTYTILAVEGGSVKLETRNVIVDRKELEEIHIKAEKVLRVERL